MANPWVFHSRPTIRKDELKHTLECMVTDSIAPGNQAKEFENKLGALIHRPFTQSVSSGTLGLFLILKLLDLKPEDEIIISAYSPASLLNPIFYLGAKPVLVDCSEHDFSLSKEQIAAKITPKTKALIISHLFGTPVNINAYQEFGLPIIENATEALGADFEGIKCGNLGDYSFFSFNANQIISTGGSGGAITLKHKEDYDKLQELMSFNSKAEYKVNYPFYLNDLQASMGLSQLKNLEELITYRIKIADFYSEKLKEAGKITPPLYLDRRNVFFRYIIKTSLSIPDSIELFKKYGIEVQPPIEKPLHQLLKLDSKEFPNAELFSRENLSIPIYPTLKKQEAEAVAKIITKI